VLINGPIWRNRTFFFLTYEGNRQSGSQLEIVAVPTAAMRAGNLAGPGATAIDPTTCAPFPGNQIPANRLNSVAVNLLTYYPLPNTIDLKISDKQLLFARFSWNNEPSQQANGLLPNTTSQNDYRNLVISQATRCGRTCSTRFALASVCGRPRSPGLSRKRLRSGPE
jgi:hypothetical protein